ncbi:unnamed protein product [Polarella glacialis]|uniref:Uncharacterized protein n=1 Tax=Polarella glacialis TaxID=89957 RepID=A0A813FRK1_POLGL|nr:unnamed protein product [Polarella glacialis]
MAPMLGNAADLAATEQGGLAVVCTGEGPRIYIVPGLDGDALGPGSGVRSAALAPHLAPCHLSALVFDEEAYFCESLSSLADVYQARILKDWQRSCGGGQRLLVAGSSIGAALACLVSLRLQEAGVRSGLILFDSEVTWPPRAAQDQTCGYDWLGGEAEAALWLARSCGAGSFADEEVRSALATKSQNKVVSGSALLRLQTRAFGQCAGAAASLGIASLQDFQAACAVSGTNIEKLRLLPGSSGSWAPPGLFQGRALLIQRSASDRPAGSSDALQRSVSSYCSCLQVTATSSSPKLEAEAVLDFACGQIKEPDVVPGLVQLARNSGRQEAIALSTLGAPATPGRTCCVYIVPGFDGGAFGESLALAPLLAPCHVAELAYDEEAQQRPSVPSLAALYNRRVLLDLRLNCCHQADDMCEDDEESQCEVILIGHCVGAAVAHQMAVQFQEAGVEVSLAVLSGEVGWPASLAAPGRDSGSDGFPAWCGGTCEAALHLARSLGSADFAAQETKALMQQRSTVCLQKDSVDAGDLDPVTERLLMRTYWELAKQLPEGTSVDDFRLRIAAAGRAMERLRSLCAAGGGFWSDQTFEGPTLMLVPESCSPDEEAGQRATNRLYCRSLDIDHCQGGHDTMLRGHNAPSAAQALMKFSQRRIKGIAVLRDGDSGQTAPNIYLLHDLDGDVAIPGAAHLDVAPMLGPCRVCALVYNREAMASCKSLRELASLYARRILADLVASGGARGGARRLRPGIVLGGSGFGALLAHEMALHIQEAKLRIDVALLLFDAEWPRVKAPDSQMQALRLLARASGALSLAESIEIRPGSSDGDELLCRSFAVFSELQATWWHHWCSSCDPDQDAQLQSFRELVALTRQNVECLSRLVLPESKASRTTVSVAALLLDSAQLELAQSLCSEVEVAQVEKGANSAAVAKALLRFLEGRSFLLPAPVWRPEGADQGPPPGMAKLHEGRGPERPFVYMVHGIDGDVFGAGTSHKTIAPLLEPCRVCAMIYDDEAVACGSLPALAALYNHRILEDIQRCGRSVGGTEGVPVVITGYSFGTVIAHHMALHMQMQGLEVRLVLFDLEVTWPPPADESRLGGYEWLGGEIEATLLIARSMGAHDLANGAMKHFLSQEPDARDVKGLRELTFSEVASRRGMNQELFDVFVDKAGRNMHQLNHIASPWEPPAVFDGEALLVLAPESTEFATCREINAKYCSRMRATYGLGTHYSLLQGEQAVAASQAVKAFLKQPG